MPGNKLSHGFTAIELLVTIFVAALFITSGYQLYAVTTTDSADIREKSIASNIAYSHLRKAQAQGIFICGTMGVSSSDLTEARKQLPGLSSISTTRDMVKSDPCGSGLMRLETKVTYMPSNSNSTTVHSQVVYVNAQ